MAKTSSGSSACRRIAAPSIMACAVAVAGLMPASAADTIPNFAPDSNIAWIAFGQDFMAPPSGPGPVVGDPAHKPKPGQPAFRVADLSNPILQPWTREELRKANERALSGKPAYTPKERCWPNGVPGFDTYPVHPVYFLQTPKEVLLIWAEDHQVRHIYMNVPHSAYVTPSWFGESVGHYENDALVVDTIGLNTRTFVDNFRTPHTDKLHVVERFHMIDGGKALEAQIHVEDIGAFTTPWEAIQRYHRIHASGDMVDPRVSKGPLEEVVCAENNGDVFNEGLDPIPTALRPDF
jgi:hypothetical protein